MNDRIHCPNPVCPQPDDVQKVSVIAHSSTSHGSIGDAIGVISTTELGRELAAPEKPGRAWGVAAVFWFVLCTLTAIAVLFLLAVNILMVEGIVPQRQQTQNPTPTWALILALVFWGGIAIWIFLVNMENRAAYRPWLRKSATWDQLYYCIRCGSVFNPNEHGRFVPASRMNELLA